MRAELDPRILRLAPIMAHPIHDPKNTGLGDEAGFGAVGRQERRRVFLVAQTAADAP